MQTRRLGDLAFMFQLYELAYQVYHAAKKDFNNDHALMHYAGSMVRATCWLIPVYPMSYHSKCLRSNMAY